MDTGESIPDSIEKGGFDGLESNVAENEKLFRLFPVCDPLTSFDLNIQSRTLTVCQDVIFEKRMLTDGLRIVNRDRRKRKIRRMGFGVCCDYKGQGCVAAC